MPGQPLAFTPPKIVPPERALSRLGLLATMVRNPIAAIPQAAYDAPIVSRRVGGGQLVFVSAPEIVEEVLVRQTQAYPKSRIDERLFTPIFGSGLLTAQAEDWRWKRRLTAPAFRQGGLAAYLPAIVRPFEDLAARWQGAPGPQAVNAAMTAATLDVICRALFSGSGELDGRRLSDAVSRYLAPVSWTIAYGTLGLPAATPHPGRIAMARAAAEARGLVKAFLERRRRGERRDDLAQVLIEARDPETGRTLGDEDLVDMFLTLLAAGHETSANGLAWALFCLAEQPGRQEALAALAREHLPGGPVAADRLAALAPIERFVKETMRLFPPVPLMARRATRACALDGEAIDKDAVLFIPVYAIHRHRATWEGPDEFDPGRFEPEAERSRRRCAYMPFGAGPRICVGASFAMLEMVVGLAVLLRQLAVLPAGRGAPRPVQRITLRPARELILDVQPR